MSLFGAMYTAISGLNSQAAAFSNISDNVANSQTVGFKRIDTSFEDILTQSTSQINESGAAIARPAYQNNIQGTIAQTDNPLGLAISGQGFFPVSTLQGETTSGQPNFSPLPAYTRAGDFELDKNGYIVNSAGNYLNGWPVDATTGVTNTNSLVPIQINQSTSNPVATSNLVLSANLPASPPIDATTGLADPVSSQVTVYDAVGTAHAVTLSWSQVADPANTSSTTPLANTWVLTVSAAGDTSSPAQVNTAEVTFGGSYTTATGTGTAPAGTVSSVTPYNGTAGTSTLTTSNAYSTTSPATVQFTANFGDGAQPITLNLGDYGSSTGLTQYAGTTYTPRNLTQDGVPPGSYSGVTTTTSGDIVVNYSNGQSRTIAQVPVITFNDPDGLQRLDGQAFTASVLSGEANTQTAGSNGAGSFVTSSTEQSNVDIATEFSQVIVAQQAYSANTKLITTAQQMLQQTIDMKQ